MASEYSVNIRLNTEQVKADLKNLKKDIDKLGRVNVGGGQRAQRTEAKITKNKDAQRAAMVETRRIGDLVQKAADKGLKVDKARNAINRAALADGRQEFKLAKAQHKVALEELKTQRLLTKEKTQQSRLSQSIGRQLASPIGGTRTMMGSPSQLGFAGSAMGRSSLRGNRFQFGSPAFFDSAARTGGARVPIGGRRDLEGSPANLLSIGKQHALPVKGFASLVGSPAYYEAQNKEILRIAKMNTLPVKGMKHIVGSPAYLQDQAKQLKKLRGATTGFTAAQYVPQQPMQGPAFPIGAAQPLNYVGDPRQRNLLPGPLGSRQIGARLSRTLSRNRGPALQSAAISGAFPLLFGQGPVAAAGGALGGGLGGAFGGQMGGFAGGLIGTAVVSGVQSFINSIKELGSALDPVNGSASQAIQSLGFLNGARAREIALIEKQIGKQSALAAVRKDMMDTLGATQTLALQEAAKNISGFQKSVSSSIDQLKGDVAKFMRDITPGSAVEGQMINRGLMANPETDLSKRYLENRAAAQSITGRSLEARIAGFTEATGFLGSGTPRITQAGKAELKRLKAERDIMEVKLRALGIEDKVSSLVKDTNVTFMEQISTRDTAFALENRILELRAQGINPAIAKEMAMLEKINNDTVTGLESQIKLRKAVLAETVNEAKKQALIDEIAGLEKGLKLLKDQNKERIDSVKNTMELNRKTDLVVSSYEKFKQAIVTDIGNGIKDLIKGTATLNDVMTNMLNKMADAFLNLAIFGNMGGNSITGGLLGMFKADGGPVQGGRSYVVGERGPEVFTPGVSGGITPNHALGGSTNISINVDASGSSVEGDEQQGRELGLMISAAIQSELIKQKRPGGILG